MMGRAFSRPLRVLLLCLASAFWSGQALAWEGQVLSVHDGDTIKVKRTDTGEVVKIRLYGIDAPEFPGNGWKGQAYCKQSRDFLRSLITGGKVSVMDMGFDKYRRTVAGVVSLPDGKVVQEELLAAGLAWVYPKYCPDCRQWKALEENARQARKGVWHSPAPVPPWEWRKGKTVP